MSHRVLPCPVKVSTIKSGRSGGKNVMIACQRFPVNDYDGYNYFVSGFNDSVAEGGTQNVNWAHLVTFWGNSGINGSQYSCCHLWIEMWDCGDQSKQCKTVTYAGNKVTANYKVIVAAGEYSPENGEETCILVNAKTVRIKGRDHPNMKVTAGILAVSAMSLTLNADSTDTWHLIEIDGSGSAALTNCILKGTGSEQNGRLVTIRGGSLTAVGCSMSVCDVSRESDVVDWGDSSRDGVCSFEGTTDIAGSSIQLEHESKQATLQITAVSSLMNTDTTTTVKTIDFAFQTPLSSSTPPLHLNWFLHASIVLLQVAWLCRDRSDSDLVLVARNRHRLSLNLCRRRHFQFCSFTGTLPTSFVSISSSSAFTLLSVGTVSFTSFSTTSSPSSSSELTLALISGLPTSTFTASTATLITNATGSLTSNTAISLHLCIAPDQILPFHS
ncbi:hypothetical protein BLNAU_23999 [Blattamonas nauphoetae]|uniref:Uncharacterized protein n=1 Tax=Blattamonas nauphoetae TaxID=2049346 RepID=A0ABQ9WNN3_9EUKA|nr:hypothetical protein BLNAU_23999 [Blattamonas nauphoetae]